MMNDEFEELKKLEILEIRNIRKYSVSAVVSLTLLLATMIATFVVFVLPLHKTLLNIAFIGGIIAGIYNISMELLMPEKHIQWTMRVPEDYTGWKALYLVSNCIQYQPKENIVIVQFGEKFDEEFRKIISMLINNIK